MALPTLEKTYEFVVNQRVDQVTYNTELSMHQKMMWDIKETLTGFTNAAWTVAGSSDGTTAGMDATDRWVAYTDLTWNTGNHSWIVLTRAAGGQIVIDLDISSATPQQAFIYASVSGGFTGGSTSARPTATDEMDITTDGNNWHSNDTSATRDKVTHYIHSTDGTVDRILCFDNNILHAYWDFSYLADARSALTHPTYFGIVYDTGGAQDLDQLQSGAQWRMYDTNVGSTFTCRNLAPSTGDVLQWIVEDGAHAFVDEIEGGYAFYDLILYSSAAGARGVKGRRPDMWLGPTQVASTGDTFPGDGSRQFIMIDALVLPWDGTSVLETI